MEPGVRTRSSNCCSGPRRKRGGRRAIGQWGWSRAGSRCRAGDEAQLTCEDCRRVGQRTFHRRHRCWGEGTVLLPGAHPGRRSKTGPASFSAYSTGQASPRPPEDPPSSGEEQSRSLFVKNEDSEVQRGKTSHTASCSYLLR